MTCARALRPAGRGALHTRRATIHQQPDNVSPRSNLLSACRSALMPSIMAELRKRIAVLDDDTSVRNALCRVLRASGFEAQAFATGVEFLASCHEFGPHCAIIDLHMPGMGGLEVQQHLSRIGSPVSVIVITGHDAPHSQSECLAAGAFAYLTKPVDEEISAIEDSRYCRSIEDRWKKAKARNTMSIGSMVQLFA